MKVFTDFAKAIEPLSDAEKGRLFTAMLEYAETSTEPRFSGNERFIWPTAKLNIDREAAYCEKQAENGRKGGRPKNPAKPSETQINPAKPSESLKDKDKDKEYKETLPIGSAKKTATVFTPPTVEMVKAYCKERGNRVDPQRFVDFYASKGWKVGNQPMKDWKAAVRTWEQRDTDTDRARKNNTLLNYDEKGRSHASVQEIELNLEEL